MTQRQREVIRLTSLGCTIKQIAAILGISHATVENHRTRAMKQLGIGSKAMLTRYAIEKGIAPLGDALTDEEAARIRLNSQAATAD